MKAVIYISGKIGEDTTLVDVIRQFKSFEDAETVEAVIHSQGGSVDEGEGIYNYLKGLDAETPVTTITDKAYSIAAKIFAAGSTRIIEDSEKPLMVHFPWAKTEGNAEKLELVAEALRELEDSFAEFYSGFLDVDEDTVRNLLDSETFVSGSDAVDLGFATEIKATVEAVAEFNIENSNKNTMTKETKKKNLGQILLTAMAAFIAGEEVEIKAELTLQDSNATDIVFPDLESGDTPKAGDKATIDGAAIPDGSYIMPSMEEATVVFVDGVITEITEKEEEVEETEAEKEARLAIEASEKEGLPKTEVKAEEVQQISVWTVNVLNSSFEVGDKVMREGWEEGTEESVGSGEFQLEDGRRVITDASGKIVLIKDAEVEKEIEIDAEASFEDLLEKVTVKVKAEIQASLTEKDNEIIELKRQVGSKEFKAEEREPEQKEKKKSGSTAADILNSKFTK